MATWDDFTGAISTAKAVGTRLTGGGKTLTEEELKKEENLHNTVKDALFNVGQVVDKLPNPVKEAAAKTGDLLLRGAVALNDKVLSPYVFRPLSTAALLADSTSPLYKKGEYEKGFQFSDIEAAYNRSAKVSTMQALTKSDLIPFIKPISASILENGGIDLDQVDLWNDKSIQKNYVDNTVGRWFTGIGDFVIGNAALGGVGKAAGILARAGGAKAGMYTGKKTIDDLAIDMENGINYAATNGKTGMQTVSGSHVTLLAESKDYGVISDIITKYSTNAKLIDLVRDASTPTAVRDLILADKGDLGAMGRLATTAPDDLFELGDTASQLQAKFILEGTPFIPTGAAAARLKTAYDAAIAKNPQFTKIRDAFFDDKYEFTPGGKAYMPMEPVVGRAAFIKGQEAVRNVKSAARFREFDALGTVLSTKLGTRIGGAVTEVVKFSSRQTEFKPLGFVTFSGVRPLDGRVELNAFLNNIKLFNDGAAKIEVRPGVYVKTADVRRNFEERYMKSIGQDEIGELEKIDAEIGRMLAYKVGIYNEDEIASSISSFRGNINAGINAMKANGFAIGHDGRRIETNAQTIRQMEESYRFTPWDSIEAQFGFAKETSGAKVFAKGAQQTAAQAFRDLNRIWTFDVLVRPMYIIKQSIAEPVVSATISQGMEFIYKDVRSITQNGFKNLGNKINYGISKAYNRSEWKAVNAAVRDKQIAYDKASRIKDELQIEVEGLLRGGASPSIEKSAIKTARAELEAAGKLLDNVELELRAAMVPIGVKEGIPSLTTLERRLGFLKSRPASAAKRDEIAQAEAAVANYKNVIANMATNTNVIKQADAALENAYKNVDNILNELKPALKEQADVWGKSAAFKKRYFAKDTQTRMVNGQLVSIESFVTGDNNFSAAMRAEISNARTADMNALGELSVGVRQSILKRRVPTNSVKVSDPLYFEELAHVANRIMRGDPLMDLILAGKSTKELTDWATSGPGIRYLENFDVYEAKHVPAYIADKVALVNRTFPSLEVRATVLKREVTAQELQSMLASNVDELYDIVPTNFAYGVSDGVFTGTKYEAISKLASNTSAKIFQKLASPENPIRNAFFDNVALDAMARKADALIKQGVEMTPSQWNALRQSSGREAIQELEKTVYTIRRQNRLLHNARAVAAFPTATVNAFYRYGRLAVKNPQRATGFAYNYGRTFTTFGVDENGNPTEDINKVTHLIVPGTKEMGLGYADEGVALNARSIGFLLNQPSPSFITGLSVGKIMKKFPGTEEGIREVLNVGGMNLFDLYFPYGAPTSITKAFTPPWLNAAYNAATGDQGKADYLASLKSVYNYHKMLNEMGIEKTFPTDKQIEQETRSLWANKFISGFISPAGVPYKVETNPMRLTTNLYYRLLEKNLKQNMPLQQARDAAGDEMINMLGTKFMVDRVTSPGTNRNVSIPATYESYKRLFDDNDDLVGRLAAIDPDNIGLVGLLTADLSRDPAEQSANIVNILNSPDLTLPGTSKKLNELRLTPQEAEAERMKNRTWQQYSLVRDALEAKITDGRTLRAHPQLKAVLDQLAATAFKDQSQAWYDEYQLSASGDKSYKYARAFSEITNDQKFMKANGNTQFWKDADTFIKSRAVFVQFYQSLPDYDPRKAVIKDKYNEWTAANVKQWDPNLETLIKNYFENDTLKAVD